jgi:hypothetical protein
MMNAILACIKEMLKTKFTVLVKAIQLALLELTLLFLNNISLAILEKLMIAALLVFTSSQVESHV